MHAPRDQLRTPPWPTMHAPPVTYHGRPPDYHVSCMPSVFNHTCPPWPSHACPPWWPTTHTPAWPYHACPPCDQPLTPPPWPTTHAPPSNHARPPPLLIESQTPVKHNLGHNFVAAGKKGETSVFAEMPSKCTRRARSKHYMSLHLHRHFNGDAGYDVMKK